ncbi:MAG TPA: WhiB family transcriptional regulator [Candidatus Saccharimonadales bacterium]|jgi:WhiB family redox-sensing transcriptional regulator
MRGETDRDIAWLLRSVEDGDEKPNNGHTPKDALWKNSDEQERAYDRNHELKVPIMRQDWRLMAACRDMEVEVFFPKKGASRQAFEVARTICKNCVVQVECLDYSIDAKEDGGVWGDYTVEQRKAVRSERSKTKEAS